jgi:hypothetical protein
MDNQPSDDISEADIALLRKASMAYKGIWYSPAHEGAPSVLERNGSVWNPLENSGQALDLAIALRMCIDCGDYADMVVVHNKSEDLTIGRLEADVDIYVLTRRLIVELAVQHLERLKK